MKNLLTFKYTIFGCVQKVGFRSYVKKKALYLQIKGSVKNNKDGSVTVIAQGLKPFLDQLESFLIRGPLHAQVKTLEKMALDDCFIYEQFDIIL
jgi:acylphosphatase